MAYQELIQYIHGNWVILTYIAYYLFRYDAFAIGLWRLSFAIDVQAYDQVEKEVDNKTVTEWVDGGKLVLNYQKRSAVGKHGRVWH